MRCTAEPSHHSRAVTGRASLTAPPPPPRDRKSARGVEVASADPNATGTVGPLPGASDDRVPPQLALAYAEQRPHTPSHAIAVAARAAVDKAGAVIGESETTVAVKGVNDQPKTSVQKAIQLAAAPSKSASVSTILGCAPSSCRRACTASCRRSRFGARHFPTSRSLMVKPASSVMMTFSPDPNLGLSHDHFSGSAIVFLSTDHLPDPHRVAALNGAVIAGLALTSLRLEVRRYPNMPSACR